MQPRIICMIVILITASLASAASMSSINEQIVELTRLCLLTSPDQPLRCLYPTTPTLSRRRRFSEAMPRARKEKDRCAMPCQKKQVPINTHSLRSYFASLLRVHSAEVTFHHPEQHHSISDPNIMFDMCVGSCRHR